MNSSYPNSKVERARPILGTTVSIRVLGMEEQHAHAAADRAFAAIERVQALMSFHEPSSDLSRMHVAPLGEWVTLDAMTLEVLGEASRLAEMSAGVFDVTVGGALVRDGLLPPPCHGSAPDPSAYWMDIELSETQARLSRPLWLDLGGIAKGFAVDRAVDVLRELGVTQGVVNAGGDLRFIGDGPHRVAIDTGRTQSEHVAALEVGEMAVATSSTRILGENSAIAHRDGLRREPLEAGLVATVVAHRCVHADALTKVVLALGEQSEAILRHYAAEAYLQKATGEWICIGQAQA